jgi:murein DD-endopeptidase MepM/ murein hydrolase activator NlpD
LRHFSDRWGAGVDIVAPDGVVVRHWHLSRFDVENGAYVEAGQQIGLTGGAKGTWGAGFSTGPHLHWGTRVDGKWVDPISLNPQILGQTEEDDDMARPMYFVANSKSPSGIVTKGNIFVRNAPGEPLKRLTDGQWSDWYNRDKPDSDVIWKEGEWFDRAFAEDNLVHEINVKGLPWMANSGTSGGSTAEQIALAVDKSLQDDFASIPKAVNDEAAKRMSS